LPTPGIRPSPVPIFSPDDLHAIVKRRVQAAFPRCRSPREGGIGGSVTTNQGLNALTPMAVTVTFPNRMHRAARAKAPVTTIAEAEAFADQAIAEIGKWWRLATNGSAVVA
jgi:hypothetical protein